jgi:hypothetical protein
MPQPGHYLPHIIDFMERSVKVSPALKSTHRDILMHMKRANRNGVRFVLENSMLNEVLYSRQLKGEDLRPPYPVTIIEYDGGGGERLCENVIIAEDCGTHVKLRPYSIVDLAGTSISICPYEAHLDYGDQPAKFDVVCWSQKIRDGKANHSPDDLEALLKDTHAMLDTTVGLYGNLCTVLESHHVEMTDVPPDDKENRIRRIRGQAPLFTYKTLVIGELKSKTKATKGGGTHASPRSHLRRGHYRTGKNGNRYWVSAAFVNGAPGFVHKDYELKIGAQ